MSARTATGSRNLLLAAGRIQDDVRSLGFQGGPSPAPKGDMYTEMVKSPELRDVTERLYRDGHYASAVLEGFKFVNNLVKQRSGLAADGAALMRSTFSLNNPRLKLSDLKTQSKKDQQQGYMDIFAGCMTGVRNPRAHDHKYLDDPDVALKMLAWADHLVSLVNNAKRTRTHKFAKTKP